MKKQSGISRSFLALLAALCVASLTFAAYGAADPDRSSSRSEASGNAQNSGSSGNSGSSKNSSSTSTQESTGGMAPVITSSAPPSPPASSSTAPPPAASRAPTPPPTSTASSTSSSSAPEREAVTVDVQTDAGVVQVEGFLRPDLARYLLAAVNERREAQGIAPLETDAYLSASALRRAAEISLSFNEERPDGTPWFKDSRLAQDGGDVGGENLAQGVDTVSGVTERWAANSLTARNQDNSAFRRTAVVCVQVDGELFWVQLFGY